MAKKKAKVQLSAKTGPVGGPIPSAMTGQIGPNIPSANVGSLAGISTIGANIGSLSQDRDMEEMAQAKNLVREQAKKKKLAGIPQRKPVPSVRPAQLNPPGTFRNVDNELVVGDMEQFQESQNPPKKRKAKVTKKK